jgi:cytochrome c55X
MMHAIGAISISLLLLAGAADVSAAPDAERQAALRHLLQQECGSCHGMTLKGGLGPALTPSALDGKPRELLINTVLLGRPGTPMPPWQAMLTEEEAAWLVDQLLEGDAK